MSRVEGVNGGRALVILIKIILSKIKNIYRENVN